MPVKTAFSFLALLFASLTLRSQDLDDVEVNPDTLKKYTYLIIPQQNSIVLGSGFFFRKGKNTYFITSYHGATGWSPVNYRFAGKYADTINVRISSDTSNFLPKGIRIDVRQLKQAHTPFYSFQRPDIAVFRVDSLVDSSILSIEHLVEMKSIPKQSPFLLVGYGFNKQFGDEDFSSLNDLITMCANQFQAYYRGNFDKIHYWPDRKVYDSINYVVLHQSPRPLSGISGAPLFVYSPDQRRFVFGGVAIAGSQNTATIVRPEKVLALIPN